MFSVEEKGVTLGSGVEHDGKTPCILGRGVKTLRAFTFCEDDGSNTFGALGFNIWGIVGTNTWEVLLLLVVNTGGNPKGIDKGVVI